MFIRKKTLQQIKLDEWQRGYNHGVKTTREKEGFARILFNNLVEDKLKLQTEIKKLKAKKNKK